MISVKTRRVMRTNFDYLGFIDKEELAFAGLSTDEKPTRQYNNVEIANASTFTEIDTGERYMYDEDSHTWYDIGNGGSGGSGSGGGGSSGVSIFLAKEDDVRDLGERSLLGRVTEDAGGEGTEAPTASNEEVDGVVDALKRKYGG